MHDRRTTTSTSDTSIVGNEAKPLPYLLAQMNLPLHGLESPKTTLATASGFRYARSGIETALM